MKISNCSTGIIVIAIALVAFRIGFAADAGSRTEPEAAFKRRLDALETRVRELENRLTVLQSSNLVLIPAPSENRLPNATEPAFPVWGERSVNGMHVFVVPCTHSL